MKNLKLADFYEKIYNDGYVDYKMFEVEHENLKSKEYIRLRCDKNDKPLCFDFDYVLKTANENCPLQSTNISQMLDYGFDVYVINKMGGKLRLNEKQLKELDLFK